MILTIILAITLFFLGRQVYWIVSEDGNIVVYVHNSSDMEEVTMEIIIDGKQLYKDSYSSEYLAYSKYSIWESLGKHSIEVKVQNENISQNRDFYILGAKWVNVEFMNKELNSTDYQLQVSIESSPLVIE